MTPIFYYCFVYVRTDVLTEQFIVRLIGFTLAYKYTITRCNRQCLQRYQGVLGQDADVYCPNNVPKGIKKVFIIIIC